MKFSKILPAIVAAAMVAVPASVYAATGVSTSLGSGTMGDNDCTVTISDYNGSRPSALIPKTITMTGVKEGDYKVIAYASTDEVDGLDSGISITPAASFTLQKTDGGATATATVTQSKTTFSASDVQNGTSGTLTMADSTEMAVKQAETTGHISADITSGSYSGTLVFTIAAAD